jgi:hypothetical protein
MKRRQTCHSHKVPLPPYSFTGSRCPGGLWAPANKQGAPQLFHERDLMPPYAEQHHQLGACQEARRRGEPRY